MVIFHSYVSSPEGTCHDSSWFQARTCPKDHSISSQISSQASECELLRVGMIQSMANRVRGDKKPLNILETSTNLRALNHFFRWEERSHWQLERQWFTVHSPILLLNAPIARFFFFSSPSLNIQLSSCPTKTIGRADHPSPTFIYMSRTGVSTSIPLSFWLPNLSENSLKCCSTRMNNSQPIFWTNQRRFWVRHWYHILIYYNTNIIYMQ